ncbi:PorV/PorQ family protein [Carboxylicivirga sp. N1Y90]|uniref:PorV/PorQ family protein n=1 Tax=Carboxylicivirga fragile TaxID=3417571 RepID=UPI003D341FBB|nr:PorV/PorQ family protein [Marinilabiliaceae bacterium N1Y90]
MKKLLILFMVLLNTTLFAQDTSNPVTTTALPFLNINTNSRMSAMGDISVVSSSFYKDAGLFHNPALLAKKGRYAGASFTNVPWLENMSDDIALTNFNAYYSINAKNTIGYSYKQLDMGKIFMEDEQGQILFSAEPRDFYHQFSYAHTVNEHFSFGAGIKYIKSDLDNMATYMNFKNVNTFAINIGAEYDRSYSISNNSKLNAHVGMAFSNIGPKIKYSDEPEMEKTSIPSLFGIGILLNPDFYLSEKLRLNADLAYQADKTLVSSESKELIHKLGSELRLNYEDILYVALRLGTLMEPESRGSGFNTSGFGIGVYGFVIDYKKIKSDSNSIDGTTAFTFAYRTNLEKLFRF